VVVSTSSTKATSTGLSDTVKYLDTQYLALISRRVSPIRLVNKVISPPLVLIQF
jgi:hypothetical protein